MPSVSELARQDQENGAIANPTPTERFLAAKYAEAATQVEIARLERTLAAKRAQLLQEVAASAALLRELSGGGPRAPELVESLPMPTPIMPGDRWVGGDPPLTPTRAAG